MQAASATSVPDATAAAEAAWRLLGSRVFSVERFAGGSCHWVFDVRLETGAAAVLRMTRASQRPAMCGALRMSRLLRPLGVPLPRILAADVDAEFPTLALERLAGTDLAHVMHDLDRAALDAVAGRVAAAQAVVAGLPTPGGFGFAAPPDVAPCATWPEFLATHVARSRLRLSRAGVFAPAHADKVDLLLGEVRDAASEVGPVAFLHDTTVRNVIVGPAGFSGIVDVDDLCFGDPRFAAALTLAVLRAYGGPRHYVATWMRVAGFCDDRLFRVYVALLALDLLSELGTRFNGNEATADDQTKAKVLAAFEDAAHSASNPDAR